MTVRASDNKEKQRAYQRERYQQRKAIKASLEVDRTTRAINLVQKYWVLGIVRQLADGSKGFSDLELALGASAESIRSALLTMSAYGLITNTRYKEVPPHVDYELTERGRGLLPVVAALSDWALDWQD